MQTAVRTSAVPHRDDLGRVCHVASLGDRSTVTVEGPDGHHDLVVPVAPDRLAAMAAAAGLWRLQWVRIHLDGAVPTARLAGTTRHPHVRAIPVAAALALAEQGVAAFVVEGDRCSSTTSPGFLHHDD